MLLYRPVRSLNRYKSLIGLCFALVFTALTCSCSGPVFVTKDYDQRIRMSKAEAVEFLKLYLRNEENLSVDEKHLGFAYTHLVNISGNVFGSMVASNMYREEYFVVNIPYEKVVKLVKGQEPAFIRISEPRPNGAPGAVIRNGSNEKLYVYDSTGVDLSGGFGWSRIDDRFISALLALCPNIETNSKIADPSDKIYEAIVQGDSAMLSKLLERNPEFANFKTDYGTPLYIAADKGNKDAAMLLLEKGANVNGITKKINGEFTPLYAAAASGHKGMLGLLLEKGADLNASTDRGFTALHIAAHYNHADVAEYLIARGARVNAKSDSGMTPLVSAAGKCGMETAKLLIAKGAEINAAGKNGFMPLHTAAMEGCRDLAQLLIEKGALVDAQSDFGVTPLYSAAEYNQLDIARLLISNNADVHQKAKDGWTPLHIAAKGNHRDMADLLINAGADINAKNKDGSTPLHVAAEKKNKDIVELLILRHADINAKNNNGWTPLHVATIEYQWDIANLLRKNGGIE
jgi:ankyrin repeat protein